MNRCMVHHILKKFSYELWKGRKPNISYCHAFGCKYFILNNNKYYWKKFDPKSDERNFLGYSTSSKAYRIYNKITLVVEESIHVIFDESNSLSSSDIDDEIVNVEENLDKTDINNALASQEEQVSQETPNEEQTINERQEV